jgi:hypothetical protein
MHLLSSPAGLFSELPGMRCFLVGQVGESSKLIRLTDLLDSAILLALRFS